jgi:hypothetical protein
MDIVLELERLGVLNFMHRGAECVIEQIVGLERRSIREGSLLKFPACS